MQKNNTRNFICSFLFYDHFITTISIRSICIIQPRSFHRTLVHSESRHWLHSIEIFSMNQPLSQKFWLNGIFAVFGNFRHSTSIFRMNQPLCEKFWLNLALWANLSIFWPSKPHENLDFWLNYAVFRSFQAVDRPKTGQNGPGKHCQVNKEKAFPVISVLESPIC